MAEVILENIGKSFGNVSVLNGLNLHIEDGEFVVLVGPSGCGKSTTLNMVAGLEDTTKGRIIIDGKDVTKLPPKDRDISMVFQSYALFPHMTVRQNIAFGPNLRSEPKAETQKQIAKVSKMLKIVDYMDRHPKELSGGQRQRVALARALVRRPGVFLMDEPLSNLDAKLRIEARSFLTKMHRELGITTIYVTHDQSEAMTMGSRIVVMQNGKIEQAASPLTVYNKPATSFVASFIGSPAMNRFDAIVENGKIKCPEGLFSLPLPKQFQNIKSGKVTLGVRPENIIPTAKGKKPMINMTVEVVQHLGHETLFDLSAGSHSAIARCGPHEPNETGIVKGFTFDMDEVHLFDRVTGSNLITHRL